MTLIDGNILLAASTLFEKFVNKATKQSPPATPAKPQTYNPILQRAIPVFEPIEDNMLKPSTLLKQNPVLVWPFPKTFETEWPLAFNYASLMESDESKHELNYDTKMSSSMMTSGPIKFYLIDKDKAEQVTIPTAKTTLSIILNEPGELMTSENRHFQVRHLPPPPLFNSDDSQEYWNLEPGDPNEHGSNFVHGAILEEEHEDNRHNLVPSVEEDADLPTIYHKYPFYLEEEIPLKSTNLNKNLRKPYANYRSEKNIFPIERFPKFQKNQVKSLVHGPAPHSKNWPRKSKYEPVNDHKWEYSKRDNTRRQWRKVQSTVEEPTRTTTTTTTGTARIRTEGTKRPIVKGQWDGFEEFKTERHRDQN